MCLNRWMWLVVHALFTDRLLQRLVMCLFQQQRQPIVLVCTRWLSLSWVTLKESYQQTMLLKTTEGYNKGSPEVMTPSLPLWSWAEPSGSADARRTAGYRNTRIETAFPRSSSQWHLLDPTDCWAQFPGLTTHFDTIYLLNLLVWRVSLLPQ